MAPNALSPRDEQSLVRTDEVRRWGTWLHLSAFATILLPGIGALAPVILWLVKKGEAPGLQVHARNYIDGIASYAGYGVALTVLSFLLGPFQFILYPFLALLAVLGVASPVLAALKARKGESRRYPLALPVLDTIANKK